MTKPKKVVILGREFEIRHPKKVDEGGSYGESMGAERYIQVKSGMPEELFEDVLLHEVLHSILYVSGVSELLEEKIEEAIVIALEHGLGSIYERNFE